jgi:hypothetical protein
VAAWITPRIGGVGPMTRAMLLRNTVRAASRTPSPGTPSPGTPSPETPSPGADRRGTEVPARQ